ncbi:MAG: Lrp/AsnC family transcriptional regulator [Candidatus Schekmanbacteria bacterium]|nr:Lrp/AsnC family transcriptional regulator [Candidatus Schekmanbacteria bacterium]
MDKLDKLIMNRIQGDFPLTGQPYKQLAQELNIAEDELLTRLRVLKERGIIRRLGAVFDSKKLGFSSTLVAAQVPEEKIDKAVAVINAYPGVTHNYQRAAEYNVWFTLIAESQERIEQILQEISDKTGAQKILNLPAVSFYKIKVNFNV